MRFTSLFLLFSAVCFNTAAAQIPQGLEVGDAVPDLILTKLLQTPNGAKGQACSIYVCHRRRRATRPLIVCGGGQFFGENTL